MATTKQAERTQIEATLADEYLSDLVYRALLERAEPSKVSEITLEINNPRITFPAVRRLVADSPRFLMIDRMWDLSARYLDTSRSTERNLIEVLKAIGAPLNTTELATELSIVYDRGPQTYAQLLPKTLQNKSAYFKTLDNRFGLTDWLPLVDADEPEDLLDNSLTEKSLAPFREAASLVTWSATTYADATYAIADALGIAPLPHRVAGVLAWLALRTKYDPVKHIQACLASNKLVWISGPTGGRWITRERADRLEAEIEERALSLGGEETEEVAPPPPTPEPAKRNGEKPAEPAAAPAAVEPVVEAPEPAAVAPAEPEPQPLEIGEEDIAALERILSERGGPVDVSELLALRYEVVAGDPSYRADVAVLEERLKSDDRFLYTGASRFREPNSLPLFVYALPEFLQFPDLQFVSRDGEIMDEEIEDEGFAGSLRSEILDPLAQDAGDDEGRYTGPTPADPSTARLVVKIHHREIGTFPLCQVPDGFFPSDAPVVEVVIRAPDGSTHDVIVNNETRLAFNLFGLYELLPENSGAVFLLHRTARPYEFRFEPVAEPDPQVYITPERMAELLALRESAEVGGDMATFDIACEVLANYAKGLTFVQAMTEVNIVRRVTRRKLASILSNYSCFLQKAGTDQWRFDPRKRDLGTDRAKRKYIKR